MKRRLKHGALLLAALVALPPAAWWLAVHAGSYPRARFAPQAAVLPPPPP